MSELIRRQDAIDAVRNTLVEYIPCLFGRFEKIPLDTEMAIRNVPSANQWIPCDERLPEVNKMVLTINDHLQCNVLSITVYDTWHDWDDCFVNDYIIAWMPLPEKYMRGEA